MKTKDLPHVRPALEEAMAKLLLHYTVMAPSSHNTQPWKFRLSGNQIQVYADPTRWLSVADADQRELYISVGCALENLLLAARSFGYQCTLTYFPDPDQEVWVANVDLEKVPALHDEESRKLFSQVMQRRTYHHPYHSQAIAEGIRAQLQAWTYPAEVSLLLIDQAEAKRRIEELIMQGDMIQFSNPAFRAELGHWIGHSTFGTPWLIAKMGQWVVTNFNVGKRQSVKDTVSVEQAPLLGLLYTQHNQRTDQVKTGQAYERLSLGCMALGIGLQPMSQPLEVPELKQQLAKLLPDSEGFPQHLFRLGYINREQSPTPRRPLEEYLI